MSSMETEESVAGDQLEKNTTNDKAMADDDDVIVLGEKTIPEPTPNSADGHKNDSNGQQQQAAKPKNGASTQKSFVQMLNEMFPSQTSYVEEGSFGPPHAPIFRAGVHVRGMKFHGESRTKQKARHEAAKAALQFFTGRQFHGDRPGGPDRPHPYASRHMNRYDNYHRYQPYYRMHERFPAPAPWMRPPPPFARPPFDPIYGPPYDSPHNDGYDDPYAEPYGDRLRAESHTWYSRDRPTGPPPVPAAEPVDYVPPSARPKPSSSRTNELTAGLQVEPKTDQSVPEKIRRKDDFTSDDIDETFVEFDPNDKEDDIFEEIKSDVQILNPKKERIILRVMSQSDSGVNQNPVSLIHELQPNSKWVSTEVKTKNHQITYQMTLILDMANETFTGVARTKKLAKSEAASKALFQLYNISVNPENSDNPEMYKPKSTVQIAQEPLVLKQDIANRIGAAVMAKCNEVWDKFPDLKKWTVLSSIVLTDDTNAEFVDVICMTSGTKCVKGDSLSMNGYALNDCHAEVLARRALLHYLYRQIERLIDNSFEDKPEFIVERRPDGFGFRIKPHFKMNLFISTAPCGDSRVFSPKEETAGDAHPNRQTRGLLRAKIEGGEGTIPVKRDAILTWDGILQGHQRLQFMSCSDKISVWNVVGLQGALLSHMLEPIYLESIVLASLFNYEHLVRAIHGRLNLNFDSNSLKGLPQRFALHKSKVAKCQLREDITRQLTRAPSYAINWIKGDDIAEVVSTDSGRIHIENTISRLAKRSLFSRFCALLGRNAPVLPECTLGSSIPVIYRDGKTSSLEYQTTKTHVMQAFQEQNLGQWIQVPSEIDLFRL